MSIINFVDVYVWCYMYINNHFIRIINLTMLLNFRIHGDDDRRIRKLGVVPSRCRSHSSNRFVHIPRSHHTCYLFCTKIQDFFIYKLNITTYNVINFNQLKNYYIYIKTSRMEIINNICLTNYYLFAIRDVNFQLISWTGENCSSDRHRFIL